LLDLARAHRTGTGGPSNLLETQDVELGELAARLISNHAQLAYETGHELSLQQPEQPVRVSAQPMLLELALRNLIENALRHTPEGTQVSVEIWRSSDGFGVSVSDDGQRAGSGAVSAASEPGLGLGLRLVGRIAEQMGATLERDAGEPPMSTRFNLRWAR
jgi:two-component system sensor histidine kinase QseC